MSDECSAAFPSFLRPDVETRPAAGVDRRSVRITPGKPLQGLFSSIFKLELHNALSIAPCTRRML